jgi:uncharacterized protein with von Willebrand factor type A (vWA) domain
MSSGPWGSPVRRADGRPLSGLDWLVLLAEKFDRAAWLNPDPPQYWSGGTCEVVRQVFPMYHLTLDGLGEAVTYLSKASPGKKPEVTIDPRNVL